jgi:DNA polymerase-1
MLSTYVDNIIPIIDDRNRIHPEFLQLGTSTGRFASKNPNIQNIPASGEYGSLIREVFIPEEKFKLVSFDYSQIELRLAAVLSQDKKMMKAFSENKDIHSAVAEEIFGEETKETRRKAKVINFGILYGMGVNSLKKNLNEGSTEEIKVSDARTYLDEYFDKFSGLSKYIENSKLKTKEDGFTSTLFGRKRFFPEINSKVPFIKAMAERMAINAPIQGTAADIIKLAMVEVNQYLRKGELLEKVKMVAQVHDELIFEVKENTLEKVAPEIEKIMEDILQNSELEEKYKKVPLEVHVSVGKN